MRSTEGCNRRYLFRRLLRGGALGLVLLTPSLAHAEGPLFVGVTTSTENSGLLAHLIKAFEAGHDIEVRAVTAGSGAVLNLAARGDVDVVLVHSPEDEAAFVASGYGIDRRPLMRNQFVIVGPRADPAGIRSAGDAAEALAAIAEKGALFLSRGDESGTHRAEQRLWRAVAIDPGAGLSDRPAVWYRESGSGQGATLNIAANLGAYTLTDEATWATFGNPGGLETLFARDDPALDNLYSIIRASPERHPGLNADDALIFADWLTSSRGQAAIRAFKVDGRSLFLPERNLAG